MPNHVFPYDEYVQHCVLRCPQQVFGEVLDGEVWVRCEAVDCRWNGEDGA